MSGQNSRKEPWMLERRAFLKMSTGLGLSTLLLGWTNPAKAALLKRVAASGSSVTPRGSARNCLLIVLRGGPSHVDTFDLKVGSWTPSSLGVEKLSTGYMWPSGIFPRLAKQANRFSLLRSLEHQEVVHERAQYYIETGRRLNPGLRDEIPHIGAVVGLEQDEKRLASDIFPAFMMFSSFAYTNNGFLPASVAPFMVPNPAQGIRNLQPEDGLDSFDRRRATLQMVNELDGDQSATGRVAFPVFQDQAEKMMKDPITEKTFSLANQDVDRYGRNYFGNAMAVARNTLKADRGTHFIEIDHYGWDMHGIIYDKERGLPALCGELDLALSALLDDLAQSPGKDTGKSLLDETLIVVLGEFGRTVGKLNSTKGRDHYPYIFSGLLAGGGVKGGRAIGATDELGAGVQDIGWSRDRSIHVPDVVTTIYSALGIDWTKSLTNTPSGRVFRYADPEAIGDTESYEIDPLF